jgi:hypothetical protein
VEEHGQFVAGKSHGKLFSVVNDGIIHSCSNFLMKMLMLLSRFSVLPALALEDGIIHCEIVEGAFDTNMFYSFINCLLNQMQPFPAAKSVIVMDNCWIHKHPAILELIESR